MVHDTVPIVPEAGSSPVVLVVSLASVLLVELELLSAALLLELLDALLLSVVLVVSALTAITFVAATLLTAVLSADDDEAVDAVEAACVTNAGTTVLSGALPPKTNPILKIINFEIRQRTQSSPN